MLDVLNILQVLLLVPVFALLGQGVLFVLAGGKHETNFFYGLLRTVSKPFTALLRRLTPSAMSDRQVAFLTLVMLLAASFWVFAERGYLLCVALGHTGCVR
ncbi:MAG: hypothetical protein ACKVQR_22745 [Aquabacterium sp.]